MKKVLIRAALTGAVASSMLMIGMALPAAAEDSCALLVVCTPADPAPTTPPPPSPSPPAAEPAHRSPADVTADLLTLLNRERASRGLPLFSRRPDLDQVAAGWSKHLAETGVPAHNDAYFTDGSRQQHGGLALGENVALDAEAQPAHDHLMASPHHRDNILDTRFSAVGLGAAYRDGSWWITEDFLQPAGAPHEAARSLPAAPAKPTGAAPPPAPAVTAPPDTAPPSTAAPVGAEVTLGSGRHWVETAPGPGSVATAPVSRSTSGAPMPSMPLTGTGVAALCALAGALVRRRALSLATS